MADIFITRLEDEMKRQGFNYKSLSRAAGLGETSVRDIITRRAKNPRRDTLQKIADALGKPLSFFLSGIQAGVVPLIGELGPGGSFPMHATGLSEHNPADDAERVEAPPETGYRNLVAVRVKGSAFSPFMPEGTLLYYCAEDEKPENCLGALCVVGTPDGRTAVRTLKPGVYYGTFHLADTSGAVTENARIEWCSRIRFIRLP